MHKILLSLLLIGAVLFTGCCAPTNDYIGSYTSNDQRTAYTLTEMRADKEIDHIMDVTMYLYHLYFEPEQCISEYPADTQLILVRGTYGLQIVSLFGAFGITREDGKIFVVERPEDWETMPVLSHELVHALQRQGGMIWGDSDVELIVIEYQAELISNRVWHYISHEGVK